MTHWAEAIHVLGALHDDVQAGQGSMNIPVEVAEALLVMWEGKFDEYARVLPETFDVKILRSEDPLARRLFPTPAWIAKVHDENGTVVRRRIIVVDEWETLEKGAHS